jgi:hypothetical protein
MDTPIKMPNAYLDTAETLEQITQRMDVDRDFLLKMIGSVDLGAYLRENNLEVNGSPLEVLDTTMRKIRAYIADQLTVVESKFSRTVAMESGNGAGGWA